MKKDVYPDVRIEIISEGLTKKILESSGSPAPSVYGEEQPEGKNLPNVGIKGKNKELQSVLETSNKKPTYTGLVKEAIQELRKDNHNKGTGSQQNFGDLTTGQMDPQTKKRPGTPFTRMTDSDPDKYGSPDQFIVTPPKDADAGVQSTASRRKGIESQVASQTQNMVKEAVQELRKEKAYDPMGGVMGSKPKDAPVTQRENVYESAALAGIDPSGARRPESVPPSERADVKEALATAPTPVAPAYGDTPTTSRENVYEEAKLQGITSYGPYQTYGGGTSAPTGEEAAFGSGSPYSRTAEGLGSGTTESIDYRPQDKKTTAKDTDAASISDISALTGTGTQSGTRDPKGFDSSAVSAIAAREAAAPTGGAGKKEDKAPATPTPSLVGGPDVDEDVLEGRSSGTLPPDESTKGAKGTEGTGDVDATSSEIAEDVTGTAPEPSSTPDIDPKITSELGLGVRANPELTRPKGAGGQLLPEFGSSGYFDAILSIGEGGKNVEANYGVTGSEDGQISPLSEFLSLYAQNPQFDQSKFLDNLGIKQPEAPEPEKADIEKANPFKASLKKQAPPMAMTMNKPANMGVGMQQPVVTGAGTMKNTEKAVAANKPAAVGASKKTKATKRKAGSIAELAKKALIKKGMVWDITNNSWVPIRK